MSSKLNSVKKENKRGLYFSLMDNLKMYAIIVYAAKTM